MWIILALWWGRWNRKGGHYETWKNGTISQGWTSRCPLLRYNAALSGLAMSASTISIVSRCQVSRFQSPPSGDRSRHTMYAQWPFHVVVIWITNKSRMDHRSKLRIGVCIGCIKLNSSNAAKFKSSKVKVTRFN